MSDELRRKLGGQSSMLILTFREFSKRGSSPLFLNPLNDLNLAKRLNGLNVLNVSLSTLNLER